MRGRHASPRRGIWFYVWRIIAVMALFLLWCAIIAAVIVLFSDRLLRDIL